MKAALYARVSKSNGQQSPEMQLRKLREYVSRRDWQLAAEYTDTVCGAKECRPQLDALMTAARRRQFDTVVVYRYDRFARSLRHLVNALEEFRALGVDFVSLHEGVDTRHRMAALCLGSSPASRNLSGS